MTFRELHAVLGKFSPEQLDKEFICYTKGDEINGESYYIPPLITMW